jgi:primosomal protein N' (replication factor Y)
MRFPHARIARMDLDTTSTKWAHHRILERFARRELDVLLGTQMIAKGLDFPGVTLVGVVDADTALHLPDFRAGERTFQLVAQVAGRAGRGPKGGRVVVQTRAPDHHAIGAAQAHSIRRFAAAELPLRMPPHPVYPPYAALARFVVSAADQERTADGAARLAAWLRGGAWDQGSEGLIVLGPAPCPIPRLHSRWRWHVLVKATDSRVIGRAVRAWARTAEARDARTGIVVDRDPVALL